MKLKIRSMLGMPILLSALLNSCAIAAIPVTFEMQYPIGRQIQSIPQSRSPRQPLQKDGSGKNSSENIRETFTGTSLDELPLHTNDQQITYEGLNNVPGSYLFTEGPVSDLNGNIYFSDIDAGKIYRWSPDNSVVVFIEGLNKPNGLAFDESGQLIVCEGGNGRLLSIDPQGKISILIDQYNQVRFNEPNDLWIDRQGGIYFTDPAYQLPVMQGGEYVYYLTPNRNQVVRVIDDLVRPNGIVGTADGKMLYVSDHGAGQIVKYEINTDGSLTGKKLFTPVGSDGMELDTDGNIFLTTQNKVQVFNSSGNHLMDIPTPENPTNVAFGGTDHQTLFITARTAVYTVKINKVELLSTTGNFNLTSPEIDESGRLPSEYTCNGAGATLPLAWSGAPADTQSYAVIMHHVAGPGDVHWYWVLYNIPANVTSLEKNSAGIGITGTNSVNKELAYTPPCSKGPGDKVYIYTVYALSTPPQLSLPASQATRDALLEVIKDITLASAELHVTYARK